MSSTTTRSVDKKHIKQTTQNTNLLRVCVIFLSLVSFFTTANGMDKYIFQNHAVSYSASAAIQGILLAQSLYLPSYVNNVLIRNQSEKIGKTVFNFFIALIILALTAATLFCSSWFSYVYIADTLHKDSWGNDSLLLVEQTYRKELYRAVDYTDIYDKYIEGQISARLLTVEQQARDLSDVQSVDIDWDKERTDYAPDDGSTVSGYMASVIDKMEDVKVNPSQASMDMAATALADAKENIQQSIDDIDERIQFINSEISRLNSLIQEANDQIQNLAEGIDPTTFQENISSLGNLISIYTQERIGKEEELNLANNAMQRLSYYETRLGLSSSTSSITIRSDLMDLQEMLFQNDPDEKLMLDQATKIFDNLQKAARTDTLSNTTSEESKNQYLFTSLMNDMNELVQYINDYASVSEKQVFLDGLVEELASSNDSSESQSLDDQKCVNKWVQNFNKLKGSIASMPIFISSNLQDNSSNSILSNSDLAILNSYDREESAALLDDTSRRYITNHNPLYDGIIYLQSEYSGLAKFALVLAFLFDISGFVIGFINFGSKDSLNASENQVDVVHNKRKDQSRSISFPQWSESESDHDEYTAWTDHETLNNYYVLTGDFTKSDDLYYYKVFRNGILENWIIQDEVPYSKGIYLQEPHGTQYDKGREVKHERQDIRFAGQGDSIKDGIYPNVAFKFVDGSLFLVKDSEHEFLSTIDDYVPVHIYFVNKGENVTLPAADLRTNISIDLGIVALNKKGTRIVALYALSTIVEDS